LSSPIQLPSPHPFIQRQAGLRAALNIDSSLDFLAFALCSPQPSDKRMVLEFLTFFSVLDNRTHQKVLKGFFFMFIFGFLLIDYLNLIHCLRTALKNFETRKMVPKDFFSLVEDMKNSISFLEFLSYLFFTQTSRQKPPKPFSSPLFTLYKQGKTLKIQTARSTWSF